MYSEKFVLSLNRFLFKWWIDTKSDRATHETSMIYIHSYLMQLDGVTEEQLFIYDGKMQKKSKVRYRMCACACASESDFYYNSIKKAYIFKVNRQSKWRWLWWCKTLYPYRFRWLFINKTIFCCQLDSRSSLLISFSLCLPFQLPFWFAEMNLPSKMKTQSVFRDRFIVCSFIYFRFVYFHSSHFRLSAIPNYFSLSLIT